MKKVIALVLICVIAIAVAFTPAVMFMNDRYSVIQFHRQVNMKFLSAAEDGYPVNADNNGKKYILAPANYDRLSELLTYSKIKADSIPSFEGKDIIILNFPDNTVVSVINYDEENDVTYIVYEENGETDYYTVSDLNLYKWVNEVVDDDGFSSPNKILPN